MTLKQLQIAYNRTKGARAMRIGCLVLDRRRVRRFLQVARRLPNLELRLTDQEFRARWGNEAGRQGGLVLYSARVVTPEGMAELKRRAPWVWTSVKGRHRQPLENTFTPDQIKDVEGASWEARAILGAVVAA